MIYQCDTGYDYSRLGKVRCGDSHEKVVEKIGVPDIVRLKKDSPYTRVYYYYNLNHVFTLEQNKVSELVKF